MSKSEATLRKLGEQLRSENPGKFFIVTAKEILLRDYEKGRDFLLYSMIMADDDTVCHCVMGSGAYISYQIPVEGPLGPPPFKVGDTIREGGRLYRCESVTPVFYSNGESFTLVQNFHEVGGYWRAYGVPVSTVRDERGQNVCGVDAPCSAWEKVD